MGIFKFLIIGLISIISYKTFQSFRDGVAPELKDEFWGPKSKFNEKQDTSIRPFSIKVEESALTDLKNRLKNELKDTNRLREPLEGIGFEYGFNTETLRQYTSYWLDKYNWNERQTALNKYPQFKTMISGLDIHFQRVKSENGKKYKETLPLLLLHGWPGSFVEFQKAIPLLTDPKDSHVNFELIIPSLPGYGFSDAAARPGLGPIQMAQVFMKLMERLGFSTYYVQGGDWGSIIATHMATLYPEIVKGIHLNLCVSEHPRGFLRLAASLTLPNIFLSEREINIMTPASKLINFLSRESGYLHLQATKPDTIGAALSNSPTGLAAYILEKFSTWTNVEFTTRKDGGLKEKYTVDELLDNVMIYWVSNSITTSMRLYSEHFALQQKTFEMHKVPVKVPTACLVTPQELFPGVKFLVEDKYQNISRFTKAEKGGHFAAFEEPQLFARDVIESFSEQIKTR